MLRNYLKLSVRHLLRRKFESVLNTRGLAIGIAVGALVLILAACLMLLLFVQNKVTYHRLHQKADLVYQQTFDSSEPGTITHPAYHFSKLAFPEWPLPFTIQLPGNISGKGNPFVFNNLSVTNLRNHA